MELDASDFLYFFLPILSCLFFLFAIFYGFTT